MPNLQSVRLNHMASGSRYFLKGARVLLHPELRMYALVPIAINCLLFSVITSSFFFYYDSLITWLWSFLPASLGFIKTALKTITWVLVGAIFVIAYAYTFNIITNTIAAPFYGLLAQKTEELLTGEAVPHESLIKMTVRTMWREFHKLIYFILRGVIIILLVLLLSTIPLLNIIAPIVALLWAAWSMTIQYSDYAADNNQTNFRRLRVKLRKRIFSSIGFGATVIGFSMIPILNIIAMPAAVVGGTMFWVNELKPLRQKELKKD